MTVNILGTDYTIKECTVEEDSYLNESDGYCDKTTKAIVISKPSPNCTLGDWQVYRNSLLRHEIIHAYLFESGLHENFEHKRWGHDETFIDWVACQFPKMLQTFKEVGCL